MNKEQYKLYEQEICDELIEELDLNNKTTYRKALKDLKEICDSCKSYIDSFEKFSSIRKCKYLIRSLNKFVSFDNNLFYNYENVYDDFQILFNKLAKYEFISSYEDIKLLLSDRIKEEIKAKKTEMKVEYEGLSPDQIYTKKLRDKIKEEGW